MFRFYEFKARINYKTLGEFAGEVYVLDDGGEVDLDLGNYERFLDVTLHSDNNITTGKIYQSVINRERKGDYLGKTVQGTKMKNSVWNHPNISQALISRFYKFVSVVPHITDAIQEWVQAESRRPVTPDNLEPDVRTVFVYNKEICLFVIKKFVCFTY